MDALSCIDQCFIADDTLEQLPTPSQVGKSKVGGIDFNKPTSPLVWRRRFSRFQHRCRAVHRGHVGQ